MEKPDPVFTPYEKQIASYWDNKINDAINLELAKKDKFIHHHFGIGYLEKEVNLLSQDEIADELHRLECNQTILAMKLMRNIGPHTTVLDAGSGRGGTAFMMHKILGCDVIGVNTSGYQVTVSNKIASELAMNSHVRFTFGNMERTDLEDDIVDAVITNETTMYIKDLEVLYREFRRVLKRGGVYVNATWCKNELYTGDRAASRKIEDHYIVRMHYRNEYIHGLLAAGLIPFTLWDFSEDAIPYWQLRSQYIHKTGIEDAFLEGYGKQELVYIMIGAYSV